MGFNKRYLPELETLLLKRGQFESDQEFLSTIIGKSSVLFGPVDSIEYIESLQHKITNERKSSLDRRSNEGIQGISNFNA